MKCNEYDFDIASHELSTLIQRARDTEDSNLIQFLSGIWDGESWSSILEKFDTEGSTWVVWWYDGVRQLLHR